MKLFMTLVVLSLSTPSFAGISCKSPSQGVEELYLGYSTVRGCFINYNNEFITKIVNPGTANEKYDCAEIIMGSDVVTKATLIVDPQYMEPGDQYHEFKIETRGGIKNFEFTFTMGPGYEWTFKNLDCVQTADLE